AITSLWLTTLDIRKWAGAWLFSAVTGFGLCILVFAVSRHYMLSLLALALSGAFDSISMVVRTAAVQLSSPDSMRGRISAVTSSLAPARKTLEQIRWIAMKEAREAPVSGFGVVRQVDLVLVNTGRLLSADPGWPGYLRSLLRVPDYTQPGFYRYKVHKQPGTD